MQVWSDFLYFINQNAPLWSFLVTIATIVYVYLTHSMLKESALARKLQTRPYILIDIAISGFWIKMIVKNIGNSPAQNVRIESKEIGTNPLSILKFIAPGSELGNVIGDRSSEDKIQKIYNFNVSYFDSSHECYKDSFSIDITPLLSSRNWGSSENEDLIKELHEMTGKMDRILDALKDSARSLSKQADSTYDIERKLK